MTAILAAFIVAIVGNVSGFWTRTTGKLSADAQARHVLDQLALDLQSALYRDDGNTWLAANILSDTSNTGLWNTTGTTPNTAKPANGAGSLQFVATGNLGDNSDRGPRFGIAGTWLRFFTVKRGTNSALPETSAPVAVGYQIVRRATSGNEARSTDRRYLLHRSEVRPTSDSTARPGTIETGFNLALAAYGPARNTAQHRDPAEIRYPTIDCVIAENVVDFGVRCYVRDATATDGLRRVFPLSNSNLTYAARQPPSVAGANDAFPEVLDIMVRILSEEGARQIANLENGRLGATPPTGLTPQAWWWRIALANSQVFTRRVVLPVQSF